MLLYVLEPKKAGLGNQNKADLQNENQEKNREKVIESLYSQ